MPSKISLPEPLIHVQFHDKKKHSYSAVRAGGGGVEGATLPGSRELDDVLRAAGAGSYRGRILPGVTGTLAIIAKPALVNWAKREALASVRRALATRLDGMGSRTLELSVAWIEEVLKDATKEPDRIKDSAADIGTRAHAAFDAIVHGKEPTLTPDIEMPVREFKKWVERDSIEFVAGDTKVASLEYGYAGSLDAVAHRDGTFILVDFKTSNGIYDDYALQTAAYAQALYETYGIRATEGQVVRLGKDGSFEHRKLADIDMSFAAFLDAYRLKQKMELEHYAK